MADVLPRGAVRNEPVVIQDEPASSSSSRPSLTPDLREIIQDLASSVRVLTDRVERVEKGDRSRSRHGSKDGPKEPPFPPPGRSATPRPSSRRPPSPPQSPRARASDGQPFNPGRAVWHQYVAGVLLSAGAIYGAGATLARFGTFFSGLRAYISIF